MSVLCVYFDKSVDQRSPVVDDYKRVVNVDEDGVEYVTYEKIDFPQYQASLGLADNWSLSSLVKAGIDPSFPIHTGFNTRLDGLNQVDNAVSYVDSIFNEDSKVDSEVESVKSE